MLTELISYFSEADFMPHGHCYLWRPGLVWTHVITDLLIGVAYLSISLTLYSIIRKIRLPFSTMVLSFGVFIGACGATHFMEVWNLWYASYWWAGMVKVLTAAASVATAIWLMKLRGQILLMAESAKLSDIRRQELEESHRILADQQKMLAHSAKMSALGEMAGGIAHEINSPLGIITLHANQLERLLKRGQLTPELVEKEAKLIASTALRIGEIIKGLRAFAREGDTDPFESAVVATIISDALVLCQTKFKNHGIALQLAEITPGLEIECRPVQISQVILNLLNNSFDAVQDTFDGWVRVVVRDYTHWVEITVTDSGPGIAKEVQARIMQPFYTTKEVGKGTGLGLSISKGIVEAHLGTIHLNTKSPHTQFVVKLPKQHLPTRFDDV